MFKEREADIIKLLAALTAAPRWVTALVIADGPDTKEISQTAELKVNHHFDIPKKVVRHVIQRAQQPQSEPWSVQPGFLAIEKDDAYRDSDVLRVLT